MHDLFTPMTRESIEIEGFGLASSVENFCAALTFADLSECSDEAKIEGLMLGLRCYLQSLGHSRDKATHVATIVEAALF